MLARSIVPCFWAPLGAAHSHDNHLLASSAALKSVLASESVERQTNLTSTTEPMMADGNANTGGTVGRDGERDVALLSRVRDDNGDARPTSTVALATTQHTTRREGTSGGRRRAGRWAAGCRAGLHARARAVLPCSSMREVGSGKKSTVCRPRCAAAFLGGSIAGGGGSNTRRRRIAL